MNRMMRISRKAVIVATLLAALPFVTVAQMPMNPERMQQMQQGKGAVGMGMMGGGMMDMMDGGCPMMGGQGMGPIGMLDLTDEQRTQINKLTDEHRRKDWDTMGKIMDEQAKLRDLYAADTPDPKKVGAVYGSIAKYRQQMIEANVTLQNSIEATLTKEQRERLKQARRGGMGMGMGRGMGHGGQGPMDPGMMNR